MYREIIRAARDHKYMIEMVSEADCNSLHVVENTVVGAHASQEFLQPRDLEKVS